MRIVILGACIGFKLWYYSMYFNVAVVIDGILNVTNYAKYHIL